MPRDPTIPDVIETPSARILSTLTWLRAGVLGANDGIVSTAAIIFGVAGAAAAHSTIILAGIAAIAAGALSMAAGEFVSVATQSAPSLPVKGLISKRIPSASSSSWLGCSSNAESLPISRSRSRAR